LALILPNTAKVLVGQRLFAASGWFLRLYRNDYSPTFASAYGDFLEATFSGYSGARDLTGLWAFTGLDSGRAMFACPLQTWTQDGGATSNLIYGYYLADESNNLMWAERAPGAPFNLAPLQPSLVIIPKFTVASEFGS
jgi:hypothetical protein